MISNDEMAFANMPSLDEFSDGEVRCSLAALSQPLKDLVSETASSAGPHHNPGRLLLIESVDG